MPECSTASSIIRHDRRCILRYNGTKQPTSSRGVQPLRKRFSFDSGSGSLIFDRDSVGVENCSLLWGSSLSIYELDHPSTQQWKRERLKATGIAIPANLRFVPIDFERASIRDALEPRDFAFEVQTLCSWMGVTQYLTPDALDATFQFALSLAPSSEVVFRFILPQSAVSGIEAEALALTAKRAAEAGEPWLTRLRADELATKFRSRGFSRIVPLAPEEPRERCFEGRRDGLRERRGRTADESNRLAETAYNCVIS